jgi:hypothetical protein
MRGPGRLIGEELIGVFGYLPRTSGRVFLVKSSTVR